MIVSFVLFVGFVVFLLLVFNPQKYTPLGYGSVDEVQAILMDNISVEYNYASVILDEEPKASDNIVKNCLIIPNIAGMDGTLSVKNMDGNVIYSRKQADGEIVIKVIASQRFYGIYSSDFFSELSPGQCPNPDDFNGHKGYSLGILTTKSAVLYENIEELNKSYYLDYGGLKESLGIKNDFSFKIRRNETDILFDTSSEKPENADILSREIPFLSINKTGSTENLFMNLGVW